MKRSELEHILRASKSVTGESELVVIGSQSILAEAVVREMGRPGLDSGAQRP